MANTIAGMFADPNSFRDERINDLMKQRQAISNMGGSMNQLLGQVAAGGGATGAMMAEGLGGMFGLTTREEDKAAELQAMMPTLDQLVEPTQMMELARKLNEAGYIQEAVTVTEKAIERAAALKGTDKKAVSTYGKQAQDEGYTVGSPAFNRRVTELAQMAQNKNVDKPTAVPAGVAASFVKSIQQEFESGRLEQANPELFKKLDSGWVFDEFDAERLENDPLLQDIWMSYRKGGKSVSDAVNSTLYGTGSDKAETDPFANVN
jgi:hypothetical protein